MITRRGAAFGWMVAAGIGFVGAVGFAGKPERDKQAELKSKIATVEQQLKTSCGCPLKIGVKWDTFATAKDMFRIEMLTDAIATVSKTQCDSADNKKALCKGLSTFEITYNKNPPDPTLTAKKLNVSCNDTSLNSEDQMKRALDKL